MTLREKIMENRRQKLSKGIWFLHDSAPAHKSHVAMQILCGLEFDLLEHSPYSLDLALSDYRVLPQLKKSLKDLKFLSNGKVIEALEAWFAKRIFFSNFQRC